MYVSWKHAIITTLPRVDVPKAHGDYRDINMTPVIARVFEKIDGAPLHARKTIKSHLSTLQFAEKVGTVLMLSCQLNMGSTATWRTRMVKQFAYLRLVDFSKAVDPVKHDFLVANILTKAQLPLNQSIHYQLVFEFFKG